MNIRKGLLLSVWVLLTLQAMAQQEQKVKYYDKFWKDSDKENAVFSATEELISSPKPLIRVTKFFIDKQLKRSVEHFVADAYNAGKEIYEGERQLWSKEGNLVLREYYENNKRNDSLITYFDNGKIKRIEIYKDDEMLRGTVFAENGTVQPYYPYHVMPEFPGGEMALFSFINKNIRFPKTALRAKIKGSVLVTFVIGDKGIVEDVRVVEALHPDADKEAMRVISSMPQWQAGRQDGKPVPVRYNIPINFDSNR